MESKLSELIQRSIDRAAKLEELEQRADKLEQTNRDLIDIHNHDVEIHISLTRQLKDAEATIKTLKAAACPWRRTDYVCHCADCIELYDARKRYDATKTYLLSRDD